MKVRRQLLRLLLLLRPQQQQLLLAVPSPSRRRDDARRPAMACDGAAGRSFGSEPAQRAPVLGCGGKTQGRS